MNEKDDFYEKVLFTSYDNKSSRKEETIPFVIKPSRMACNIRDKKFTISHDKKEYKFFTLHYVMGGSIYFQTETEEYILKKGDIFIMFAEEKYIYYKKNNEKTGLLWAEFDCSGCEDIFIWLKTKGVNVIKEDTQKTAQSIVDMLWYVKNNKKPSQCTLSAMSYAVVMSLYDSISTNLNTHLSNVILLSQHYIVKNIKNNITIKELAEYANVSESTITKHFKKYAQTSPLQYIILKRIKHAIFLLKNTNLSCEKIATECGFYDPAHLYKAFINNLGKSPSEIRLML